MSSATLELPTMFLKMPSEFVCDKRKEDWELVENGEPVQDKSTLQLDSFLREGEPFVKGAVVHARAKEKGDCAGQFEAEWMLANQSAIPYSWRNHYLVFPCTVWRDAGGHLRMPFLRWDGDKWLLAFGWLAYVWRSRGRLVRFCR